MLRVARVVLIALLAGVAAEASAQSTATRTAAPVVTRGDDLDLGNGAVRLAGRYVAPAGAPLAMEAERASLIRFTPGKGVLRRSPDAGGGLYLAYVDRLEYELELKEGGSYTAWYRATFPLKGNWNHTENMDGGPTRTQTDSQGEVLNQWLWVKGPTYELQAGPHSWNFAPFGWCGGTGLDRVLLSRDPAYLPNGLGPDAAPSASPAVAEAFAEQLFPRTLVRWQKVRWENASGAGKVELLASTDSAVSWQAINPDGDLSQLPPGKPLALRLRLTAGADGGSPYVKGLQVDYEARALPPIVLENADLRLRFAGDSGGLQSLTNKHTGTEYLVSGVETPLFSFVGTRPEFGTVVEIGFGQAQLGRVVPAKDALTMDFSLLGGALRVALKVALQQRLARFSMNVSNRSPYELAQVRLLSPRGLRIGEDCKDDTLFTPITTGSIVKYPAALEFPRQIYTDRPLAYPGMATMCWMDLWDERGGGVYLACQDPRYRLTELTFSNGTEDRPAGVEPQGTPPPGDPAYRYAKVPGTYVNLGFDKRLRVARGAAVEMPEVVVGVHEGDWHWGADQYRAWAEPWMTRAKRTPDWFRDDLGVNNVHAIHLGNFVDIPKGRPRGGRQGTMQDTLFPLVAMWCQNASCESSWSTPVLHLLLGNEEEFVGGVQKQHEMGHRFVSYNLPRAINPLFNQGQKRIGIVPIGMYPADQVPPQGFYGEVGLRLYDGSLRSADGVYSEGQHLLGRHSLAAVRTPHHPRQVPARVP